MGLRVLHLVVGFAGLIAFMASGLYMVWAHAGLQGMADGPRLFFRSAHIYLLWGALLNLLLGCYLARVGRGLLRHAQSLGSLLILAGPFMLAASFFAERHNPELDRPIGQLAIFLALGGAALHAVASLVAHARSGAT
jgi:hypothetical protein